jgi:predicted permease
MSSTHPPRLARRLLALVVPGDHAEALLGDLDELHDARVTRDGARAARRWYWRQTAQGAMESLRWRLRRAPRQAQGDSVMQMLAQDVKLAVRSLTSKPGFTFAATLMLALGIGANVTIFSWVNAVLLNPLPGTERPAELVQLTYLYRGSVLPSVSYPDYRRIRDASRSFQGVVARDDLSVGVVIDREAERAWGEMVSGNFFDVLGVKPVLGRTFTAADDEPGAEAVAVLGHAYWMRRFNGDPSVVGRQVRINAHPFTIVGVAPPGFHGAMSALRYDLWMPVGTQPVATSGGSRLEARGFRWLGLLARRMPGVSMEQARDDLQSTIQALRESGPGYDELQAAVFELADSPDGGVSVLGPVLTALMAVAAIVLLIACANLAGLLVARASARSREIAIRQSLGAGRGRIVQQLLVEGLVLGSLGTAGAVVALAWTADLLVGFAPPSELPIFLDVQIDARVLAFAAALAVGTVLLFALVPALEASTPALASTLRDTGSAGRTLGRHRLRRVLVAAQVALSITLLVGAGLCLRSLAAATRLAPGFNAEGVVVGWLDLLAAGYTAEEGRAFYSRLLDRVGALPGVEAATLSRRIPLGFSGGGSTSLTVEGYTARDSDPRSVGFNVVGPDYARTLQIPLVAGRDLRADDVADGVQVALISESMARLYWEGRDPLGGRFAVFRGPNGEPQWITVVGVTRDVKHRRLTEPPQPYFWLPVQQTYGPSSVLHVRTATGLDAMAPVLQRVVREIDPQVPFFDVGLLADHTRAATFQQQLAANLLSVFGALALVLASIGSYGVLSYLVGLRRREIGIRLAIGATRADVFRLMASGGLRLMAVGIAIGLLLATGVGFGLRGLLIGVSPVDPVTYATVLAVMAVVTAAACLLPARRASVVDPVTTLREE